jgi:hypothetical protein
MTQSPPQPLDETVQKEDDTVKTAISSGDLDQMVKAVSSPASPTDRHFLLQRIVEIAYKNRKDPEFREVLFRHARMLLAEYPNIVPTLQEQFGSKLPNDHTFKLFTISLEEDGRFEEAIGVCKQALEYGMDDETKTGFEGRIERIKRKQKAAADSP